MSLHPSIRKEKRIVLQVKVNLIEGGKSLSHFLDILSDGGKKNRSLFHPRRTRGTERGNSRAQGKRTPNLYSAAHEKKGGRGEISLLFLPPKMGTTQREEDAQRRVISATLALGKEKRGRRGEKMIPYPSGYPGPKGDTKRNHQGRRVIALSRAFTADREKEERGKDCRSRVSLIGPRAEKKGRLPRDRLSIVR